MWAHGAVHDCSCAHGWRFMIMTATCWFVIGVNGIHAATVCSIVIMARGCIEATVRQ